MDSIQKLQTLSPVTLPSNNDANSQDPTIEPTHIVAFPRRIAALLQHLEDGSRTHSPVGGLCGWHFGANPNIDKVEPAPLGLNFEGWVHSLQGM